MAILDKAYVAKLDIQQADRAMQAGRLEEARAKYREAVASDALTEEEKRYCLEKLAAFKKPAKPTQKKHKEKEEGRFITYPVKFSDVIGQNKVKKKLYTLIKLPIDKHEQFKQLNLNTSTGIIFYGPPGTGKTFLTKAISGEFNIKMADMQLSDILTKYLGEPEQKIREIFQQADKEQPALIFIDELDAIGSSRDGGETNNATGAAIKTITTELLKQISNMHDKKDSRVYVIGATNVPWSLDSALKRSGRLEYNIYIGAPTLFDRKRMFSYYLKTEGISSRISYTQLAWATLYYSPADIEKLCKLAKHKLIEHHKEGNQLQLRTKDILSVLKDKEYGASSLDQWYLMVKSNYIGTIKKSNLIIRIWRILRRKEPPKPTGKEGSFTDEHREIYKELVKEVEFYVRWRQAMLLLRWFARNLPSR